MLKKEEPPKNPIKMSTVSGKLCREMLRAHRQAPRVVPAFSYQALQKNTIVLPPPKINVYQARPVKQTNFEIYVLRGDIPVVKATQKKRTERTADNKIEKSERIKGSPYLLKWLCPPQNLDYCYYFPIFIDGLADNKPELRLLAKYAAIDLINKGPNKILPVLPRVILPFKRAFNTRRKTIIIDALKVLQEMVRVAPCVGQALVPYYRQLLGVCNLYKNMNVNLLDGVEADRSKRIGDVIEDTLKLLEQCGGPTAYLNIKYMIPTYESMVSPKCGMEDFDPIYGR
ncbi:parkin coregulated gene protein homolog [Teleopsis dalmanni]|uniref:parkin coregulated gene protein homolog n=1 Tax=Teleopsis dalmanni TaxID=139649 RepID=UPI000D32C0A2|nr:parkin coregulated gene protein homolog [Teleopsis dalmanni]XP_037950382.1 parkin coregulated gene protein homolog [Teleopsis dalmanni]